MDKTLVTADGLCYSPFSANPTKWSNTLKQFVGKLPTNCLSAFDQFVLLAVKVLNLIINSIRNVFACLKMFIMQLRKTIRDKTKKNGYNNLAMCEEDSKSKRVKKLNRMVSLSENSLWYLPTTSEF